MVLRAALEILQSAMDVASLLWYTIFRFLNLCDLTRVASVCISWWRMVYGEEYFREKLRDSEWRDELNLARTDSLYLYVPVVMFRNVTHLTLCSTLITNQHLLQIVNATTWLDFLDISNCAHLFQPVTFKARPQLNELTRMDISHNSNFTILAIACLCSCSSLELLVVHGIDITLNELQFLSSTFEAISSGELVLNTGDGPAVQLVQEFDDLFYA